MDQKLLELSLTSSSATPGCNISLRDAWLVRSKRMKDKESFSRRYLCKCPVRNEVGGSELRGMMFPEIRISSIQLRLPPESSEHHDASL